MKNRVFLTIVLLAGAASPLCALEATFDVNVYAREVRVLARLHYGTDTSVRIDLPAKARLLAVSSPASSNVFYIRNVNGGNNALYIDQLQYNYSGRVDVLYALPVNGTDFILDGWMPAMPDGTACTAHFPILAGYEAFPLPYREQTASGFVFLSEDKPEIVFGKYSHSELDRHGRRYRVYYPVQLNTPLEQIASVFEKYESLLARIPQTNVLFVALPTGQKRTVVMGDKLFVVFNRGYAGEIRTTLANVWFDHVLKMPADYAFAFSDLYARLIDNNGGTNTDDAVRVPVPSRAYYEKLIAQGFPSEQIVRCDVDSMLKNFALLHFVYYLAEPAYFEKQMHAFAESGAAVDRLAEYIAPPGISESLSGYVLGKLLPVAPYVPDLSVDGTAAYRNSSAIPDVAYSIDNAWRVVQWGDSRKFDVAAGARSIQLDPQRQVPQLDFANDRYDNNPALKAQRDAALQTAVTHRHFQNESYRDLLDFETYMVPENNSLRMPAGTFLYVAVVKFIAPVDGQLRTGLKELFITISEGKAVVITDRIRI